MQSVTLRLMIHWYTLLVLYLGRISQKHLQFLLLKSPAHLILVYMDLVDLTGCFLTCTKLYCQVLCQAALIFGNLLNSTPASMLCVVRCMHLELSKLCYVVSLLRN